MLFEITGDYDVAFYIAGAAIAISGLVCMPLRMLGKCQNVDFEDDEGRDPDSDADDIAVKLNLMDSSYRFPIPG